MFSAALIKVASRCNLNCDYCYVYNQGDTTWRSKPALISDETIELTAKKIAGYVAQKDIPRFSIIFHGGEPLLYGAKKLEWATTVFRRAIPQSCEVDFSLQTNGVLLSEEELEILSRADIGISISLDGPPEIHNAHRVTHGAKPTFDVVVDSILRIKRVQPTLFSGVIAVIDTSVAPSSIFEFFDALGIPKLDLLLPDATHERPPLGREKSPERYLHWLSEAFQLWYSSYNHIPVRWFDAIVASCFGLPSPTDVMGMGAVSLLVIDTDGEYSDHDVFKIAGDGRAQLNVRIDDLNIEDLETHEKITNHNRLLQFNGLAPECQTCPVVAICGGGAVMHRYHPTRQFSTPSVYCKEMFGLISVAMRCVRQNLPEVSDSPLESHFALLGSQIREQCRRWASRRESLHGNTSDDAHYCFERVSVNAGDSGLINKFRDSVKALHLDKNQHFVILGRLSEAESLLKEFSSDVFAAISILLSNIVLAQSKNPDEAGIFSFSDDSVPNVIYIDPFCGGELLSAEDIADSILHEFLHHVLYHLERESGPFLHDHVHPRMPAPWRTGLRESGGVFHGTFVFFHLALFWRHLDAANGSSCIKSKTNADKFAQQAAYGLSSLEQFSLLTHSGAALISKLRADAPFQTPEIIAPGQISSLTKNN